MHQSYDELEYLLSKFETGTINDTNDYGDSPLHWACRNLPPYIIRKLLDKGARHDIANVSGNTPIHLAFIKGDLQTILHLLRSGANMFVVNDAGKMPIAMCRNDSDLRESVIMLYIKSSLPLDKLYTGMMQWNPKPSIHEVLWFCIAGGVPEEHVLLSYLPHITDQSCLDILFSTCPLYLRNNMGNVNTITLELSIQYTALIDAYINTFPTLATLSRQCVRKLFSNKFSLLPQLKALYGEILITKPVFLYVCLLENMHQTNHKHVRAICKFLGTEFHFKKYDIEPENDRLNPPNTPLFDDNMESPTAIQNPKWILDQLAQTCPYHLTSAKLSLGKAHSDDNKSSDAEYISEPVCKLLNSFLSQLDQTYGSSTRLKMCGSLRHDNQVSIIDDIDFMTIKSSKNLYIEKDKTGNGRFVVKRLLVDDSLIGPKMKVSLCHALSQFLRYENRPDNPGTGQVYGSDMFSLPSSSSNLYCFCLAMCGRAQT